MDPHLVSVPSLGTLTTRAVFISLRFINAFSTSTYVFRVVCLRTLVGSRTGPLTLRSRSLARLMRSPQTELSVCNLTTSVKFHIHFSKGLTFLEVRVILILWVLAPPCAPDLSRSSLYSAILLIVDCCCWCRCNSDLGVSQAQ